MLKTQQTHATCTHTYAHMCAALPTTYRPFLPRCCLFSWAFHFLLRSFPFFACYDLMILLMSKEMSRWPKGWNGWLCPDFFAWTHIKYILLLPRLKWFFTFYVSVMCGIMSPLSTKDALSPETSNYITLYGKRDLANIV